MDVSSVMATLRSKTVVCPGVYSQGKVVLPHLQLRIEEVVLVSPVVVAVVADAEVVVAMVAEVAMAEVADHNSQIDIALEYKPNEPRAFSLMPDAATTLLAITEIGRDNTGVTLDFAHVLYADEMPAFAANLIARHSRVLDVHLNDGYGK